MTFFYKESIERVDSDGSWIILIKVESQLNDTLSFPSCQVQQAIRRVQEIQTDSGAGQADPHDHHREADVPLHPGQGLG